MRREVDAIKKAWIIGGIVGGTLCLCLCAIFYVSLPKVLRVKALWKKWRISSTKATGEHDVSDIKLSNITTVQTYDRPKTPEVGIQGSER
jgi:hypothetical protein